MTKSPTYFNCASSLNVFAQSLINPLNFKATVGCIYVNKNYS